MEPITRKENFLARIAGEGGSELEPITREEHFLQKIIDAGGGGGGSSLPSGGTTGQVLIKLSSADGDAGWADTGIAIENVTGTTPSITLADNTVFSAGELTSLTVTGSLTDSQSCVIIFTSGSTETQLTIPSALKMPDSFVVEADKIYEISIMGNRGAVQSWSTT